MFFGVLKFLNNVKKYWDKKKNAYYWSCQSGIRVPDGENNDNGADQNFKK